MNDEDKEKVLNACAALAEVSGYSLNEVLDGLQDAYLFTPGQIDDLQKFAETY